VTPAYGVAQHSAPAFLVGSPAGDAVVDESGLGSVTLSGATTRTRSGSYLSSILDAQAMVDWDRAVWDVGLPGGSRAVLSVRTGSTTTPDSSWSAWRTVPGQGGRTTGSSRFLQYRIEMTSNAGSAPPRLHAIGFSSNGTPPNHEKEGR
jgi:hypothetical protein